MLHNDENFNQLIVSVADNYGIDAAIVEKDYYLTLFIKLLIKKQPKLVCLGGFSLLKNNLTIKRFSEDIDISMESIDEDTEQSLNNFKSDIEEICKKLNFDIITEEKRQFAIKFLVNFDTVLTERTKKKNLNFKATKHIAIFDERKIKISSFIYKYLKSEHRYDLIQKFELEPFNIIIRSEERTFIDKLFILGNCYICNTTTQNSKHLYDIYKLFNVVEINSSLKKLYNKVYSVRSKYDFCFITKNGMDLKQILQEIIDKDVYKSDYENLTKTLLYEDVCYSKTIEVLQKIVNSGLFD